MTAMIARLLLQTACLTALPADSNSGMSPVTALPATAGQKSRPQNRNSAPANANELRATVGLTKLPIQELTGPHADRARHILKQPVLRRSRPPEVFACDPVLLEWLFSHPIWATELWRAMGVPISSLSRVGDGYECREDNALARIHVVHQSPGIRVIYCYGEAKRPPLPGKLRAEMVVVQRYAYSKMTDGQYHAVQQLEAFAYAEGAALKAIMKLTRGACEQVVDRCLQDMTIYFALLARVLQLQPAWALENIERVRATMPEAETREIAAMVARNPGRRATSNSGELAEKLLKPATTIAEPMGRPTAVVTQPSPFVSSWTLDASPAVNEASRSPANDPRAARPATTIRR